MNYPNSTELEKISKWRLMCLSIDNFEKFLSYLETIWNNCDSYEFEYKGNKIELHTGGWSGCEDIINALKKTEFWFLFWQKSIRGGHYYFTINKKLFKKEN